MGKGQQRDTSSCEPGERDNRMGGSSGGNWRQRRGELRNSLFLVKQVAVEEAEASRCLKSGKGWDDETCQGIPVRPGDPGLW